MGGALGGARWLGSVAARPTGVRPPQNLVEKIVQRHVVPAADGEDTSIHITSPSLLYIHSASSPFPWSLHSSLILLPVIPSPCASCASCTHSRGPPCSRCAFPATLPHCKCALAHHAHHRHHSTPHPPMHVPHDGHASSQLTCAIDRRGGRDGRVDPGRASGCHITVLRHDPR